MASHIIADIVPTLDAMPSSVPSRIPRLGNLTTNSTPSIRVDHEAKVVTRPADGTNKKAIHSTVPSISNTHARASSSQRPQIPTASARLLNRRHSAPKVSDMSSRNNLDRTQISRDSATLEDNRESTRALSEFLKRSQPPPSSFTSRPESDAGSLHSIKKSTFRFFGRQKSKKAIKNPKLMQLPDSAVSAKTTGGARHIAISIPLEYDHPYIDTPTRSLTAQQPPFRFKLSSEWPERGPIVVLKPVAEVRESISSLLARGNEGILEDKRDSQAESVTTPSAKILGLETSQTLEENSTQPNPQQKSQYRSPNAEGKMVVKQVSAPTQKCFIAVPPVDIVRHDSTQSDPRHSGGSAYSTTSLGTTPSHSRGQSSATSVPSPLSPSLKLDLPPRNPSIATVSRGIETELANTYNANRGVAATNDPARSSFLSENSANESITPSIPASHSPPIILETAKTAQGYNAASSLHTISRGNTPKALNPAGPEPTRELPDLPESPCIPKFFPSCSPPICRQASPDVGVINDTISNTNRVASVNSNTEESTRKQRQDRVRARKQRDVALHRDKSADKSCSRCLLTENVTTGNPESRASTPLQDSTGVSLEKASRQALNTVTDIMLVADIPPFTKAVSLEDLAKTSSTPCDIKMTNTEPNSPKELDTPPMSFSSSAESDTDTMTQDGSLVQSRGRVPSTSLDARRQERRLKRNMSLREKEVDARLGKIERDNAVLLRTLSGIAGSFGDLSLILPCSVGARAARRQSGLFADTRGIAVGGKREDGQGEVSCGR